MMNEYLRRLSTFATWPASDAVRPQLLAENGFYYTGRDDTVQCYRCSLALGQWLAGDDPLTRHQRTNLYCPVATHNDTLNGAVQPSRELQLPFSSLQSDDVRTLVDAVTRSYPDEQSWQHLRLYSFRRPTFRDWPHSDIVDAASLAHAGFFYTGYDDWVRCAFCRREFNDWQPGDVPAEEHRRGVPNCPFVLQNFCSPSSALSLGPTAAENLQRADQQVLAFFLG